MTTYTANASTEPGSISGSVTTAEEALRWFNNLSALQQKICVYRVQYGVEPELFNEDRFREFYTFDGYKPVRRCVGCHRGPPDHVEAKCIYAAGRYTT